MPARAPKPAPATRPTLVELAERLKEDIRKRKLRPGEAYLNAADAARLLGVGTAIANRALQLLQKQAILQRSQRRGAILLPRPFRPSPLGDICFLVEKDLSQSHPSFIKKLSTGLKAKLGISSFNVVALDPDAPARMVDRVITATLASSSSTGLVVVSASLETQRQVAGSGLPALLLGTPAPSVSHLPSLEPDWEEGLNQMVSHALRRNCRHFATFSPEIFRPEDHRFLDALGRVLESHSLSPEHLLPRSFPSDADICREAVRQILRTHPRTAFLCHSPLVADAIAGALPGQIAPPICIVDPRGLPPLPSPHLQVEPALSPPEIGEQLAHLFTPLPRKATARLTFPTRLLDGGLYCL